MPNTVDLMDFPQGLATQLGISLFAGQILASIIFLGLTLFPVLLLTKGRNIPATILVGLSSLGFCVALNWFPIWVFTLICLSMALLYGQKIIGVLRG